jgi:hypothetical protein
VDEPTAAVYPRTRDLSLKLIFKIACRYRIGDAAEEPPWHDLLKAVASDQAVIRFALGSVGAMRLWPRFKRALHMCDGLVFDEIARRRRHPELERLARSVDARRR